MENQNIVKRKAISGIFWKFGERFFAQFISLTVSIILARILVPEDFSVVSIVTIFFSFSNILISGGLNTALIQKKDTDELDYSSVLFTTLFICLIVYGLLYFFAPSISSIYNNDLLTSLIRVMGLTLFVNALKSVICAKVSSNLDFRKFFFSTSVGTIISAIVGITMALNSFGAWSLVAQQMSNTIIDTICLAYVTKFKLKFIFSFKRLNGLFQYGWKIFAASIISEIYEQINPLIIGLKFSSADLAFYTKGKSFPALLNASVSETVSAVIFPVMSKFQNDMEYILILTRKYMRLSSYIVFPLMIGFFAVSDNFILLLLTDKWASSIPFVKIFCVSFMFNIIQTGNLQVIRAIGRSDILLLLEIIKKISYFLIIFLFVFFSQTPEQLALSSIFCTIVATIVNTYPNRNLIGYKYRLQFRDLLPNLSISILMGIIVIMVGLIRLNPFVSIIIQIITGILVYIILSLLTKNENFIYLKNMIISFIKRGV